MGVYINMEMPKVPGVYSLDLYVDEICQIQNLVGETFEAIEIPQHGRLIDADALDIYRREEKAQEDIDKSPFSEYLEGLKDGLHEAAKCLSTAPTIIEAEPPESCGDCNHYCTGQFFNNEEICMVTGDNAPYDISDCPFRKKEGW